MELIIDEYLSQCGIKPTTARCEILKVLREATLPLNYEQIKSNMTLKMDKATFYRNMSKFEEKNIVSKFESDDRKWYYVLGKIDHPHFICEECHEVTCIDMPLPQNIEGNSVKNVIFKGTCKDCE